MDIAISQAAQATASISFATATQMVSHTLKMAHACGFDISTGDTYHRRFTVGDHRFVCSVSGGKEPTVRLLAEVPEKNWEKHGEQTEVTS